MKQKGVSLDGLVLISTHSNLDKTMKSSIEGVQFDQEVKGAHQDERRRLSPAFNSDLGSFIVRQVKLYYEIRKQVNLGGHYHHYREVFYMRTGRAVFTLRDMNTGREETYVLTEGNRLLIPPRVAHKAVVDQGSFFIGMTEEPYTTMKDNDIPCPF